DRSGQSLLHVEQRVDHALATGFEDDVEIAAAHRLEPGACRHYALGCMEPDSTPLVDQPGADIFVGLIDISIEELEAQTLRSRLFQQALGLGPRLLDVGPEAGK